jgi:hypothetical protein
MSIYKITNIKYKKKRRKEKQGARVGVSKTSEKIKKRDLNVINYDWLHDFSQEKDWSL